MFEKPSCRKTVEQHRTCVQEKQLPHAQSSLLSSAHVPGCLSASPTATSAPTQSHCRPFPGSGVHPSSPSPCHGDQPRPCSIRLWSSRTRSMWMSATGCSRGCAPDSGAASSIPAAAPQCPRPSYALVAASLPSPPAPAPPSSPASRPPPRQAQAHVPSCSGSLTWIRKALAALASPWLRAPRQRLVAALSWRSSTASV
jgi:hypothetical protein